MKQRTNRDLKTLNTRKKSFKKVWKIPIHCAGRLPTLMRRTRQQSRPLNTQQ